MDTNSTINPFIFQSTESRAYNNIIVIELIEVGVSHFLCICSSSSAKMVCMSYSKSSVF